MRAGSRSTSLSCRTCLLRQKHSMATVRNSFGHQIKLLVREAETLGLVVGEIDRFVLALIDDTDAMIDSRYIRTGTKLWPRSKRSTAPAKEFAMVSAPSCATTVCRCGCNPRGGSLQLVKLHRRFPRPWSVEGLEACFVVRDAPAHAKVRTTTTTK